MRKEPGLACGFQESNITNGWSGSNKCKSMPYLQFEVRLFMCACALMPLPTITHKSFTGRRAQSYTPSATSALPALRSGRAGHRGSRKSRGYRIAFLAAAIFFPEMNLFLPWRYIPVAGAPKMLRPYGNSPVRSPLSHGAFICLIERDRRLQPFAKGFSRHIHRLPMSRSDGGNSLA